MGHNIKVSSVISHHHRVLLLLLGFFFKLKVRTAVKTVCLSGTTFCRGLISICCYSERFQEPDDVCGAGIRITYSVLVNANEGTCQPVQQGGSLTCS